MEQPQVGPKGKGVGSTESNYPDERVYEEMGTGAFAMRMTHGQEEEDTF